MEGRLGQTQGVEGVWPRRRRDVRVCGDWRGRGGGRDTVKGRWRGQQESGRGGAVQHWLCAAVLGLGRREWDRWRHRGEARGGRRSGGVLLGLGGGRGRGGETEQRAEASRGGQRRPKLMGGRWGNHMVKNTWKSHSRNGRESGERKKTEQMTAAERERREGQREKQGLSRVEHKRQASLRQAGKKSKQSQSTASCRNTRENGWAKKCEFYRDNLWYYRDNDKNYTTVLYFFVCLWLHETAFIAPQTLFLKSLPTWNKILQDATYLKDLYY